MKKQNKKPEIIDVKKVGTSRLFNIESVELIFHNGEYRVYERIKSTNLETVIIVPIINGNLVLIQEYAVGIENYTIGFPKGLINFGESTTEAADRELKEETGYGSTELEFIGKFNIAPSYLCSINNIFLAEGLYEKKLQGDEPESLIIYKWPLNKMMDLLKEPSFCEARNISALFLARECLLKKTKFNC
ncbi:ADP compounds hydrolase NudE [Candidatus Pantoea edessiphila]|uniref:ADP compounds hydrolase NudE n=1 Tax=Candidatus Pantoea edessiphila TaxID=2044610 RepID=A0A2P5SXZ6_9GAMM|nr:ADP compounds hydrolase NudE [Candidatus Pantoea edessiphila]MBK4775764.1 ADP compounds hydrolase NudE [Pantoea sp. Edef]PPI87206.1 ADP compounds hydrolase NudE [Candidatus Pantoea edessiphila]